jgi:hypothetical protein
VFGLVRGCSSLFVVVLGMFGLCSRLFGLVLGMFGVFKNWYKKSASENTNTLHGDILAGAGVFGEDLHFGATYVVGIPLDGAYNVEGVFGYYIYGFESVEFFGGITKELDLVIVRAEFVLIQTKNPDLQPGITRVNDIPARIFWVGG